MMILQIPFHQMMLAATALLLSESEVVSASCHVLADGSEFCEYRDACVTPGLDVIFPESSTVHLLPADSNLHVAASSSYSQASATATWVRNGTALLMGRDVMPEGSRVSNPFHFAMFAVQGFTALRRLGMGAASFTDVMVPTAAASVSLWQRGLLEVLFGASASLVFEGGVQEEPPSAVRCFERLVVSGRSYELVAGAADAQRLREAVAERFPHLGSLHHQQPQHVTLFLRTTSRSFRNEREVITVAEQRAEAAGLALRVVRDWGASTPFEEQLRVMATTALLVAAHGAALTNALFLPPASAVLEVSAARAGGIRFYERVATNAGHHHARYTAAAEDSFPHYAELQGYVRRNLCSPPPLPSSSLERVHCLYSRKA